MKTILVPVDFSQHSEYALRAAAKIAKSNNASIIAIHMLGLNLAPLTKDTPPEIEGMYYMQLTKKRFQEFLDKDYLKGIEVTDTVMNDTIFSEFDSIASKHKADLIVMGSHGSSGLSEVFVGSNTEKVVRSANVPVLVIKNDDVFDIKRAIFASDFRNESLDAFNKAMSIFQLLNTEIKLVFINTKGDGFLSTREVDQRILDFMIQVKGYDFNPEDVTIYSDYTVEEGVFNFAKKINADLIGIPTHGHKGLAHFFAGSIGEDIVNHSKIPVLTVKIS